MANLTGAVLSSARREVERLSVSITHSSSPSKPPPYSVEAQLRRLGRSLRRLEALIHDAAGAGGTAINAAALDSLLSELRDAVYDAGDFSEGSEAGRDGGETSRKRKRAGGSLASPLSPSSCRARDFLDRIDDISRRLSSLRSGGPAGSDSAESLVFGRNHDRENLVELLLSEDNRSADGISVVPLLGEEGVGKTTLLQLVRHDASVREHFDVRIWISVAGKFESEQLLGAIVRSVTGRWPEDAEKSVRALLNTRLRAERLLLVLDQVLLDQPRQWMSFISPFVGAGTVKIIVATWKDDAVRIVQTVPAYRLARLPEDETWSLFERCAFDDKDPDEHRSSIRIAREINKKCDGSPLVAKTIASALRGESNERKWVDICESDIWLSDQSINRASLALLLIYDFLPSYLKPCLAYCSFFPTGYNFNKNQLVRLWMAQGFIRPNGSERVEDIGSAYFEELVKRSLVQLSGSQVEVSSKMVCFDDGGGGDAADDVSQLMTYDVEDDRIYVMHSLIKDASYSASDFSTQVEHLYQHELVLPQKCSSLRTYIYMDDGADHKSFSSRSKNGETLNDLVLKCKSLHALVLSSINIDMLPYRIGNLKNLQYLCLKCNIASLPASVCELYNLHTLDLSGCVRLNTLPENIGNLTMLRHLDLPPQMVLYYPANTGVAISLVCLPHGISKLTNLQNLAAVCIGRDLCGIAAIKHSELLRGRLIITGLRNLYSVEESKEGNLKNKMNLQMLILDGNDIDPSKSRHESGWMVESGSLHHHLDDKPMPAASDHAIGLTPTGFEESILESLQPHTNLEMLVISSYAGSRFPNWVGDPSFSKLTSVTIDGSAQNSCSSLPPLGQLPSLKSLFIARMYGIQSVDHELYCLSNNSSVPAFPSLLDLTFEDMHEWETWSDMQDGHFPRLHKLAVTRCFKLRALPLLPSLAIICLSNLSEITVVPTAARLVYVEILSCKNLRSLTLPDHLHSLRVLKIRNCPSLKLLTGLPNQVCLECLAIHCCPVLQLLQDETLPLIPQHVDIRDCPCLTEWCQRSGILQKDIQSKGTAESVPSSSLLSRSVVYGRNDDKRRVLELLFSDKCGERDVSVICIVAANGLGKTTIVHLVYNDLRVCQVFEIRGWVSTTQQFGVEKLMKAIIESLTGVSCLLTNLSELQEIVKIELDGRRFLLVLEDIWNEDKNFWNSLLVPLRVGAKGSIVLVTTREKMSSSMMGLMTFYQLNHLSEDYCWLIFRQEAFHNRNPILHLPLADIGKQIVSKCQGIPLVAKVLGGLLSSSADNVLWMHILQSELWNQDKLQHQTLPILRLSYDYLPAHLRWCFSYCSLFPKGYMFEKDHIVRLWMSQGLTEAKDGHEIKDFGNQCFDELLRRSFFQYSQPCDSKKEKFVIHDLMFDFAQSVLGDDFVRIEHNKLFCISDKVHHISVVPCDITTSLQLEPFKQSRDLRTLMLIKLELDDPLFSIDNIDILNDLFLKFKNLQTLDLSYTNIKELPESVGHLKFLCYLAVNGTLIKRLPDTLCSLRMLQTLELRDCGLLHELPKDTKNLVNLRHLDVSRESGFVYMPVGVRQLTSVRTLPTFYVGGEKCCCNITELKGLVNLSGRLRIAGLENVISATDAEQAKLKDKRYLQNLTLQWLDSGTDFESGERAETAREVLESLQPNTNLEDLTIQGYFGVRLPSWILDSSFSRLVSITLDNCPECEKLPTLGHLPSLKYLSVRKMNNVQIVGREFCGLNIKILNKFPSLEVFQVWEMYSWEVWLGVEDIDFPCLRCFSIGRCLKLKNLPSFTFLLELSILYCTKMPEIQDFPSLKKLKIEGIKNLKSLNFLPTLPVLEELDISRCYQLISIVGLMNLPSIKQLKVTKCPKLYFSPNEELPRTLHFVNIHRSCSSLSNWYPNGFEEEATQASRRFVRQKQQGSGFQVDMEALIDRASQSEKTTVLSI